MKRFSRAIVFLAAIVLTVSLVLSGCASDKDTLGTKNLTKEYFENNIDLVIERSFDAKRIFGDVNPFSALFNNYETVRMVLGADLSALAGVDGEVSLEVNSDIENHKGSVGIDVSGIVSKPLDLNVYADKYKLVLSSDAFLGEETYYGIEFKGFEETLDAFAKSQLAVMLGIDEETFKMILDEYGINKEYADSVAAAYKEYAESAEAYAKEATAKFSEFFGKCYGEITEGTVETEEGEAEALILNINLHDGFVNDFADIYLDVYKKSITMQYEFLDKVFPAKIKEQSGIDFAFMSEQTISEAEEQFEALFASIDIKGNFSYYIDTKEGLLRKAVADYTLGSYGETDNYIVNVYFGDDITFDAKVSGGENGEESEFYGVMYHTESETEKTYTIEMSTPESPEEITEFAFKILKSENRYNLYANVVEGGTVRNTLFIAEGQFLYTENSFGMSLDSITADNVKTPLGINFEIGNNIMLPSPDSYKNLFELTEDELYAVIGRISSVSSEIYGQYMTYDDIYADYGEYDYSEYYDLSEFETEEFSGYNDTYDM